MFNFTVLYSPSAFWAYFPYVATGETKQLIPSFMWFSGVRNRDSLVKQEVPSCYGQIRVHFVSIRHRTRNISGDLILI